MQKNEFYYDLPESLIAQSPLLKRDMSKLLVLSKETGDIQHKIFRDITDYLNKGDVLVINDSKVLPARIFGTKKSGAVIEFVLLRQIDENTWETLVKPGKKARIGDTFVFSDKLSGNIINIIEEGIRIIKFDFNGVFLEILEQIGKMPLPPYITKSLEDNSRYQTVYADEIGSSAAPTAGLHFTEELLQEIEQKGVKIAKITLHVGLGTFRPVKVSVIEHHKMHSEYYSISSEAANLINTAKEQGKRVIAVGTTSCRTIESAAENGTIKAKSGFTDIFIYPGYKFKILDALITNFHLPESTLIMLVSALAGKDNIFKAYNEAIKQEYRFFSFGDAMLIV